MSTVKTVRLESLVSEGLSCIIPCMTLRLGWVFYTMIEMPLWTHFTVPGLETQLDNAHLEGHL